MNKYTVFLALIIIFLLQFNVYALTALSFTGNSTWSWSGATIGWEFSIGQNVNITALGIFDEGNDGLATSHQVGIWNLAGTLLVSNTVLSGTSSVLQDRFRYESVNYTLAAGTYVVGAYMPDSQDKGAALATYTTHSLVTYNRNLYLYGSGFVKPTNHWTGYDGGNFGANFQFNAVPVPELSTSLCLIFGIVTLLFKRFSKR